MRIRKSLAIVGTAVALSGSLGLVTAAEAAAASRPPQCVKVMKYYTKDHKRYVQLKNLCTQRKACYVIVVPGRPDPHGRLDQGVTKAVGYGTDRGPRALYVKNTAC
ncbi:hypothetical protein [Streptomyces sp. MST-110588]|uniref:hypothetical protein n=1 Tax=Streptomyces sp. MST-110588 TaxID=2833628 RepID=UPI001F5DE7D9|nr:hypothetical protein [Streptomyces sp. MST-110588]UNO43053.1 hypothetical protein KGS77_30570 [Streptomyces sp. MST-110588]